MVNVRTLDTMHTYMRKYHPMHASLADIVADIAANSIEAGAELIKVDISENDDFIVLKVVDNGKGMDEKTLARAFNPFFTEEGKHDKRKVGLGLPFVKQTCDACGGNVSLESEKGRGTTIVCSFASSNIDLPPMGDMAAAALSLFSFPGKFEMVFSHSKGKESYSISRSELIEAVGGLEDAQSLSLARDFLQSQEEAL